MWYNKCNEVLKEKMKPSIFVSLLFLCHTLSAGDIKIAVSANVSYAIDDLKKAFFKHNPHTKVKVTLGGSGKLTAQINHGAPYQLFMSANMIYPTILYHDKLAVSKPVIYAQGSLAYLSTKKQDFTQGMSLCKAVHVKKIAIANPKTAPYGKATLEVMKNSAIYADIVKKLVYAESISQTVYYTVNATDLGLVAKSALYSPRMAHFKEDTHWSDVNASLYTPIDQGIVILKEGEHNSEVLAFYNFILSAEAKEIFKRFGYIVP